MKSKDTAGNSGFKEYTVNAREMRRRKLDFSKMLISFELTVLIFAFRPVVSFPEISVTLIIIAAAVTALLIIVVSKMLNRQSDWKFYLSGEAIEKQYVDFSENYPLSGIKSIRVKRTCKGYIREIRFKTSEEKPFFINGLNDFEGFYNELTALTENRGIEFINYKEPPVDYDRPVFYLILGSVLGIITSLIFKFMFSVSEESLTIIRLLISGFLIVFGSFCVLYQPVRSRYGRKSSKVDIIFGLISLGFGILIIILL